MKIWKKPTPEQVERVVAKLTRPAAYRYFFSGLNNPEWIEPLRQGGFFDSPPAAIRDEDSGTVLLPDWPAAKYLARVAPERPELVAQIVERIPDADNEEFYGELIEIALRLPAEFSVSISRRLRRRKNILNWSFLLIHLVARLVAHLVENGQESESFKLAAALFGQQQVNETSPDVSRRTQLDVWEYAEALKASLPSLVKANSVRSITFLSSLIEAALLEEGLVKNTAPQIVDMSALRSGEVGNPDENMALCLSDILAKKLCTTAIEAIKSDAGNATDIIETIEKKKWDLFLVIALRVLAEVAPFARETARARMLDAELIHSSRYGAEYSRLLQTRFGELSSEEQATIIDRILGGPDVETAVTNYTKLNGQGPPRELLDMFRKSWLRDRLLWIPERYRSSKAQTKLSALLAELGPPEPASPIRPSWYDPASPKSDEEFAAMSPPEVLRYLGSWSPLDDPQKSSSRTGLGRQLQNSAREKPYEFASVADQFIGLSPIYVRHFLWGLDEALTKGTRGLNWSRIVVLGAWMVMQPRGQEPHDTLLPFPFRDDESWIGSRHAAAHLFSDGLLKDRPPIELRQPLWRIIATLAEDPNPTRNEEKATTLNEWVARSLNSIRGNAIHAVIYYAYWIKTNSANDSGLRFSFDQVPEVRRLLDEHLDMKSDPSLAVRSIYGQHFALLTSLDKKWAIESTSAIFPEDENVRPYWNAAWSSYIRFSGVYNDVFEILRPQYALAVERINGEARDSHADDIVNRLGAHLMTYYWRGVEKLKGDLIPRFMLLATPKERGDALGFIGRSLINTKTEVPAEVKDRLQVLWDLRLQAARASTDVNSFRKELASFGYWFSSGQFDDAWAIVQLQEVMRLIGECGNAFLVIKRLAAIVSRLPFEVISCLESVLVTQGRSRLYASTLPEVQTVLDVAVASADRRAREVAVRIGNLLAEQGDLRFRELVGKADL